MSDRHEPITAEAVAAGLDTRWAGRGLLLCPRELPSTNAALKELARQGAPHGSLAVCHHQTAGRGRMTRTWETPPGEALTFSLLLRPKLTPAEAQLCTLAAALAMAQTVRELFPALEPRIKWPNDLVIGQKKCCGILSEMGMEDGRVSYVVTGVGLNVNQTAFPPELEEKAASLLMLLRQQQDAAPLSRTRLLCRFLAHMEAAVEQVEQRGFAGIREAYTALSATIGQRVQVLSPAESYTGLAMGVDDAGALLVKRENGQTATVLCGDVSVRGLMGYV